MRAISLKTVVDRKVAAILVSTRLRDLLRVLHDQPLDRFINRSASGAALLLSIYGKRASNHTALRA
jgi:hypothetical protein